MKSDFYETWYNYQGCIKDAPEQVGSDMWMHTSTMGINLHARFCIWIKLLNGAEFGGVEQN